MLLLYIVVSSQTDDIRILYQGIVEKQLLGQIFNCLLHGILLDFMQIWRQDELFAQQEIHLTVDLTFLLLLSHFIWRPFTTSTIIWVITSFLASFCCRLFWLCILIAFFGNGILISSISLPRGNVHKLLKQEVATANLPLLADAVWVSHDYNSSRVVKFRTWEALHDSNRRHMPLLPNSTSLLSMTICTAFNVLMRSLNLHRKLRAE